MLTTVYAPSGNFGDAVRRAASAAGLETVVVDSVGKAVESSTLTLLFDSENGSVIGIEVADAVAREQKGFMEFKVAEQGDREKTFHEEVDIAFARIFAGKYIIRFNVTTIAVIGPDTVVDKGLESFLHEVFAAVKTAQLADGSEGARI